jgi:hypothetical protein
LNDSVSAIGGRGLELGLSFALRQDGSRLDRHIVGSSRDRPSANGRGRVKPEPARSRLFAPARLLDGFVRPARRLGRRFEHDAIDRAWRQAQLATGAPLGNHGVHVLGRTHDGIDRAGPDAHRATNAVSLIDPRQLSQTARRRTPVEFGATFGVSG